MLQPQSIRRRAGLLGLALAGCVLGSSTPAPGFTTPFGQEVAATVRRGLDYLRSHQRPDGSWQGGGDGGAASDGKETGLCALAFLEERVSADWSAPSKGYNGLTDADKERLHKAMRYLIGACPRCQNPVGRNNTYFEGSALIALAVYVATGGRDDVGAAVGARRAVENLVT
ncbi:MAG: hypothetical protein FJ125_14165, partial [Deltaproteobacteria bacterium]|nr:hypothetical protein [Deltaproteobacteria bacterium]